MDAMDWILALGWILAGWCGAALFRRNWERDEAVMASNVRGAEVKMLREKCYDLGTEIGMLKIDLQQERERVQTLTDHILAMKRDGFVMVDTADEDEDSWSPPTSEEEAEIERRRRLEGMAEFRVPAGVVEAEPTRPGKWRYEEGETVESLRSRAGEAGREAESRDRETRTRPLREMLGDVGEKMAQAETLAGRRAVLTDISVEHFPDETSE